MRKVKCFFSLFQMGSLLNSLLPLIIGEQGMNLTLLVPSEQAYLVLIDQITQSLNQVLLVASQPGGLESDLFIGAILDAARTVLSNLTAMTGPLPPSVSENIMGVLHSSLLLALRPEMAYAQARNLTLDVLWRGEGLIQDLIPMAAEYLLPGIKLMRTYFQIISTAGGPDKLNEMWVKLS